MGFRICAMAVVLALLACLGCGAPAEMYAVEPLGVTLPTRVLKADMVLDGGTLFARLEDAQGAYLGLRLPMNDVPYIYGDPVTPEVEPGQLHVTSAAWGDTNPHPLPVGGPEEQGVVSILRCYLRDSVAPRDRANIREHGVNEAWQRSRTAESRDELVHAWVIIKMLEVLESRDELAN